MARGRPAITNTSIANIFFILFGDIPIEAYLINSRFLCLKNPRVLEKMLARPMAASKTHNAPNIRIIPFFIVASDIFSWIRFSIEMLSFGDSVCKISFCNSFSSERAASSAPSIRIYVSGSAWPSTPDTCFHSDKGINWTNV